MILCAGMQRDDLFARNRWWGMSVELSTRYRISHCYQPNRLLYLNQVAAPKTDQMQLSVLLGFHIAMRDGTF